jgi:hypothetical protein
MAHAVREEEARQRAGSGGDVSILAPGDETIRGRLVQNERALVLPVSNGLPSC